MRSIVSPVSLLHPSEPAAGPAGAGERICPGCSALAYPDDRYCACCGARLDAACAVCGSAIVHPVANYCTHCGIPIEPTRRR